MKAYSGLVFLVMVLIEVGCGVKSKPLPPLKEPWISTGDFEKDKEKKEKIKRPVIPAENRAEFAPQPTLDEKNER